MEEENKNLRRDILRLKIDKFIYLGLRMDDIPIISGRTIIYGGGIIGKLLVRCFDKKPDFYIDNKLSGQTICGLHVYSLSEAKRLIGDEKVTVIVTPVWDFNTIRDDITKCDPHATVLSLEELLVML